MYRQIDSCKTPGRNTGISISVETRSTDEYVIRARSKWLYFGWKELWEYRYLVTLFIKRDIKAQYKQTLLGPLWHVIQPLITTMLYTILFGFFAKLPTDGLPSGLFYLSGVVIWNLFSTSVQNTSTTFLSNASIFGKIYFPRMVAPVSILFSTLFRFAIQLVLLACALVLFSFRGFHWEWMPLSIIVLPSVILILSSFCLGLGLIVSSLTTKYRDLNLFLGFGLQLCMYVTPVIYPPSFLGPYSKYLALNPLSAIISNFRACFFSSFTFDLTALFYPAILAVITLLFGIILFNRTEKDFMDTI